MDKTKIEWCDSTFNPWIGCTKISPACDNCYAERERATKALDVEWGPGKSRHRTSDANWKKPERWNGIQFWQCVGCGWRGGDDERRDSPFVLCPVCACEEWLKPARRRVFCASLADVFDNEVPWQWRLALFGLIRDTPNLDWLLLTKRIGNVKPMLDEIQVHGPIGDVFPNIWLGATICNQEEADRDILKLLAVPANIRFLSIEPLLGEMRIDDIAGPNGVGIIKPLAGIWWKPIENKLGLHWSWHQKIDWVIVGGESGSGARPMHPDWVRSLRNQCMAAGVPFLFKQWGQWVDAKQCEGLWADQLYTSDGGYRYTASLVAHDGSIHGDCRIAPDGCVTVRSVGKKVAARWLDGREWSQFPNRADKVE